MPGRNFPRRGYRRQRKDRDLQGGDMRALAGSISIAVAMAIALCATAQGATFQVYTCLDAADGPLGRTIGWPGVVSGWEFEAPAYIGVSLSDDCAGAGGSFGFQARFGTMTAGQAILMRWTPATGTRLVGVQATWTALDDHTPNRGWGTVQVTQSTDRQVLLAQNSPLSMSFGFFGERPFEAQVAPASSFEIRFTCLDQCPVGSDGAESYARVVRARFDVDDASPPVGGLTGSATDAQTWSGVMHLGLNGADVGGGLMRAVVEVDGADALAVPVGDASPSCRDIGPSPSLNEFAAAQPCPLRIDGGALDVDSAKLPQGRHSVRVLLEDAAGNRTAIFGPVVRNISATGAVGPGSDPALRGAANGDGATDQARLTAHWGIRGGRTRLVSRFGRTHVVRGRLTGADGAPIANAAIDVVSKTTAVNARELVKRGGPRTESDGRWRLVLPRNVSSRDVTFRYRSHVNDTVSAATATVHLRVRAGLRLEIHPRHARRGQAIRFAGRLLGGPLPRGGKQIVLMARASHGGWVRFNVVRSDHAGRFHTTYRFQQPGTTTYRFRALSLAEAAYPYAAGGSNVVRVLKR
jgi:hypothetical protein